MVFHPTGKVTERQQVKKKKKEYTVLVLFNIPFDDFVEYNGCKPETHLRYLRWFLCENAGLY